MKKVIAAALLCAVSSFAGWDYFPVIEDGKGEAKIAFSESRQGLSGSNNGPSFKVRYSPLQNLELMSAAGENHVIGLRYQIIPVLSAGVDAGFPIAKPAWSFTPNVQFSMPFTEALVLGSNVELTINTEDKALKETDYMNLSAGVELDFTIGKSTLWASFAFGTGLGEKEVEVQGTDPTTGAPTIEKIKKKAADDGRGTQLSPAIGYLASVGNLSVGTSVGFDLGEKSGNKPVTTTIGVDASVKF